MTNFNICKQVVMLTLGKMVRKAGLIVSLVCFFTSIVEAQDHNCNETCPLPELDVPNDVDFSAFDFSSAIIPELSPMPDGQDGEFYCVNISFGIPQFLRSIPPEVTGEAVPVDIEILSVQLDRDAFKVPPGLGVICAIDGLADPDCMSIPGGDEGCFRIGGTPTDPIESFAILATFTMSVDPLPLFGGLIDPPPTTFTFEDVVLDTITIMTGFLPIELASFTATMGADATLLGWSTIHEQSSYGFEVQRSYDGTNFEVLHFEPSTGEFNGAEYSYPDKELTAFDTYYRLKLLDMDGSYEFSEIVRVAQRSLANQYFYPNPAGSRIFLSSHFDLNSSLSITNEVGQNVLQYQPGEKQSFSAGIDVSGLAPGIYFVRLRNETFSVTRRLVKH